MKWLIEELHYRLNVILGLLLACQGDVSGPCMGRWTQIPSSLGPLGRGNLMQFGRWRNSPENFTAPGKEWRGLQRVPWFCVFTLDLHRMLGSDLCCAKHHRGKQPLHREVHLVHTSPYWEGVLWRRREEVRDAPHAGCPHISIRHWTLVSKGRWFREASRSCMWL